MNDRGWIKLHRRLAEHELWLRERFTRGQAWVDLLMTANHTERQVVHGGLSITVGRGQVYTSQVALAQRWQWNRETVRIFLRELQAAGMLAEIKAVRGVSPAIAAKSSAITSAISKCGAPAIGYTLLTLSNYEQSQALQENGSAITSAITPPGAPSIPKKEPTTRSEERSARSARSLSPAFSNGVSRKHVDAAWGRE